MTTLSVAMAYYTFWIRLINMYHSQATRRPPNCGGMHSDIILFCVMVHTLCGVGVALAAPGRGLRRGDEDPDVPLRQVCVCSAPTPKVSLSQPAAAPPPPPPLTRTHARTQAPPPLSPH